MRVNTRYMNSTTDAKRYICAESNDSHAWGRLYVLQVLQSLANGFLKYHLQHTHTHTCMHTHTPTHMTEYWFGGWRKKKRVGWGKILHTVLAVRSSSCTGNFSANVNQTYSTDSVDMQAFVRNQDSLIIPAVFRGTSQGPILSWSNLGQIQKGRQLKEEVCGCSKWMHCIYY